MPFRYTTEQYKTAIRKLGLVSKWDYSHRDRAFFRCCFHSGDDSPSLSISFKQGVYHCFGCGASGNIPSMIRNRTGESMESWLNLQEEDLSRLLKRSEEPLIRKKAPEDRDVDIRGVMIPFSISKEAQNYLIKRHIDFRTATQMNMKYIEEAYINGSYFLKRLMIPIYNDQKQMINIEGRDVTFKQDKKCLYPMGGKKVIYEWYKLDKNRPLFLVEGLIKLAILRSDNFFENSSCTMGNMVSPRQISQLNLFKEVVVIPDNDKGGIVMVNFLRKSLTTSKVSVYRIGDSSIKDVDEIPIKTGKSVEQFRLDKGFHLENTLE
jgi:hypothetical protein